MVNYYEILDLELGCSPREVKRSFRKKAKELHPDLKYSHIRHSEEQMRILLTAYEVLSNPNKRTDYDRAFSLRNTRSKFNYREYLRKIDHDLFSQAKLIFYDLLNSNDNEALELYQQLTSTREDFNLEYLLGHEDYMDCLFLLAEALEQQGEYINSCEMYKNLYKKEQEMPYFHHFVDEVIDRLRTLTCFKMVSCLPPQTAIQFIKELGKNSLYEAFTNF